MLFSTSNRNRVLSSVGIGFLLPTLLQVLSLFASRSLAFLSPAVSQQQPLQQRHPMSVCRAATEHPSIDAYKEDDPKKRKKSTLKVLLLHGKGSSGPDFASRMGNYFDVLRDEQNGMELDVVTIDGPISLGDDTSKNDNDNVDGFAWWNMPPFVRSYNATEYEGFETSAKLVLDTLQNQGPFDVIYGHSQGAILTTALLALERIPVHPQRGYVLNGVAWPNPFSKQMESLQFSDDTRPNVLLITGLKDKINAPDTQEQVKKSLLAAGALVSQIVHPAGHNIPMQRGETLSGVLEWMVL